MIIVMQSRLKAMEKEHEWILEERELFNRRGTDYDFEGMSRVELESELDTLRRDLASLQKQLNKKVMALLDKAKSEYATLIRKRNTVTDDRRKIERVIERLDAKTNGARQDLATSRSRIWHHLLDTSPGRSSATSTPI
jgi:structural maintenance of chromosome 2